MTRIFDALKKAEGAQGAPAAPAESTSWSAPRGGEILRTAMPLLGAAPLGEDALRAVTSLRVGLESALPDRGVRIVLFLSPQGGEGTSTVALQFAQMLARDAATRPLLIDCNARRPAYHLEPGQRCALLDRALLATSTLEAAEVVPNLSVVTVAPELRQAGMIPPGTLRATIEANASGFDWIVLDGPPVLDSPDAAAFGPVADGVVIVLQAGRTKRPVMTRAAELLGKSGARLLGTVLNRRVLEIPEFIYRRI